MPVSKVQDYLRMAGNLGKVKMATILRDHPSFALEMYSSITRREWLFAASTI